MTFAIPIWALPMIATAAIWAVGIFKPFPPRRGDYDFTGPFVAAARLALCIIATLTVWCAYLAARLTFGV